MHSTPNPKADWYFAKAEKWHEELELLRPLVLSCGLTEEVKWGCPCYTLGKSNIVLLHTFKEYCAMLFFKGALMKDDHRILIQQTGNVQSARQVRFTGPEQITGQEAVLRAYVLEAIEVEKSSLKVTLKKTEDFSIPAEFQAQLDASPDLQTAFSALTPGRQKAYLIHFAQAKQAKTREARVDKLIPRILAGKGLLD